MTMTFNPRGIPMSDDPLAFIDRNTSKFPRTLAESRALVLKRTVKPPAKYVKAYQMSLNPPKRKRTKLKLGWYRGQPKYVNPLRRTA